jgi:UDP-glucuronate decarboxylase
LACPASPKAYQFDPIKTLNTCSKGSINVLEFAKKNNSKILFSSTSEIYGNPLQHPQSESYFGNVNPIGPRSCYDEGKRYAESLFVNYHNFYNINIKIARLFNVYGPYMDRNDGRVISNFIVQCLEGKPITVAGNGKQTRSFCYVSDLVNGLIKLMKTQNSFIGPVNIGNPKEYNIYEIAEKIKKLTKSKSKIKFINSIIDDPLIRKPNIRLAKKELNWTPEVNLNDGLKKTIQYFKDI